MEETKHSCIQPVSLCDIDVELFQMNSSDEKEKIRPHWQDRRDALGTFSKPSPFGSQGVCSFSELCSDTKEDEKFGNPRVSLSDIRHCSVDLKNSQSFPHLFSHEVSTNFRENLSFHTSTKKQCDTSKNLDPTERKLYFDKATISMSNFNNSSLVPLKEALLLMENPDHAYCLKHRPFDNFDVPGFSRVQVSTPDSNHFSQKSNRLLSNFHLDKTSETVHASKSLPITCDGPCSDPQHDDQQFTDYNTKLKSKGFCVCPTALYQQSLQPSTRCNHTQDRSENCHINRPSELNQIVQPLKDTRCYLHNHYRPKRLCRCHRDNKFKQKCREARFTPWGSRELRRLPRRTEDFASLLCRPATGINDADFEIRMSLSESQNIPIPHHICDKDYISIKFGSNNDALKIKKVEEIMPTPCQIEHALTDEKNSTFSNKNIELNNTLDCNIHHSRGVAEITNAAFTESEYLQFSLDAVENTYNISNPVQSNNMMVSTTGTRIEEKNNSNEADPSFLKAGRSGRTPRILVGEQYGGHVIRVEGDGRCLFRSLITALTQKLQIATRDEYGRPTRTEEEAIETQGADDLRERVVHLMRDNLQFYSELERGVINADQPRPINYQRFLDRLEAMKKKTTMPGDFELNAVALVLERPILVLNSELRRITIYGQDRFPQMPVLAVRYTRLGADVGHYDAVILDHRLSQQRPPLNQATPMEEGEPSLVQKVCTSVARYCTGDSGKAGGCSQCQEAKAPNQSEVKSPKLLAKAEFNFNRDPRLSGRGGGGHRSTTLVGKTVKRGCTLKNKGKESQGKLHKKQAKKSPAKSRTDVKVTKSVNVKNNPIKQKRYHKAACVNCKKCGQEIVNCKKCGQEIVIRQKDISRQTNGESCIPKARNEQRRHKRVRLNSDKNDNMGLSRKRNREHFENEDTVENIDQKSESRPAKRFCNNQRNTDKDRTVSDASKIVTNRVKSNPTKAKHKKTQSKKLKTKIKKFVNDPNIKNGSPTLSPSRVPSDGSDWSMASIRDDKNVRPPKVLDILASSRRKCSMCGKMMVDTAQRMVRCYLCGKIAHRHCTTQGSGWSKEGELYLCLKCMPF